MSTRVDPKRAAEGEGFRRARYEIVTRHALALDGVLAAEVHLADHLAGPVRLVAQSLTASLQAPRSHRSRRPMAFDSSQYASAFFPAVLAKAGLHTYVATPAIDEDTRAPAPNGRVTHLVAERIDPLGQVHGLMLFALDRAPADAELRAFDLFVAEARRITESRLVGRQSSSVEAAFRLEAVLQLAQTALLGGDLAATLQAVVDRLRDLFTADLAVVLVLDEDDGALRPMASTSSDRGYQMLRERAQSAPPRNTGVTGWVARNKRPALIANTEEDRRPEPRPREIPESMLAAPLLGNGKVVGVIRIGALGTNRFGPADVRLLEAVASQVAVVVESARLRDELRQQNERLALLARLVESSRDAILFVDPQGRVARVNPAMERLFDYRESELVGRPVEILRSTRNPTDLDRSMQAALAGAGDWEGEIVDRRKDGSEFPAEVHVSAVLSDDGERVGTVHVIRDLTRRKEREAEEVQSEKLRSLGVMAAGVAHEVNNSLASVLGQADLLLRLTDDSQARRCLEAIIGAAEDGAGSVKRITEFARPSSDTKFAPIDLAEVARDVLAATAPRVRHKAAKLGRAIDAQAIAPEPVWVLGAVTELREAVTNLVINAVDALPNGGSIYVEANERSGRAVLSVSDTGTGMSDEVKQRVFDPFFTTKPFGQGTGLGLALVYGIVERHSGEIRVLSHPGEGTTFEIEMDLAEPPEPEKKEEKTFAGPQGLRVLVVEDEQVLGEQLRSILSLDGHSVRLCSSGEEALDALDHEYDLVITDLGMPGIGGKEVASVAKARYPRMPVGLVTGWTGDFMNPSELGGQNVDFVVPKPYRIQSIREAVAKACAPPPPSSEPVLSR